MNGFWTGGGDALDKGFREAIARLENELATAGTPEEQESIRAELEMTREKFDEISRGDLIF